MYLNISETRKSIGLKLKIYMQVTFYNSVWHFDKFIPPFKSSNLNTNNQILDNMSCPLYKSNTNGRIYFNLYLNVQLNKVMCRTYVTIVPA